MEDAPTHEPVRAPLPQTLRPYLVLQTEPASAPAAARFEGWWAMVWRNALPCVQIERARSLPVGRALVVADEGAPGAVEAVLDEAALFVTAETSYLAHAARRGIPTVYVPDGPAGVAPPEALAAFAPERLRVLRAETAFRRELPLAALHGAIEELLPGSLRREHSESSKCRARMQPYLRGRLADLGHGGQKIAPHAVGVDFFKVDAFDWIGDVRDLWFFEEQCFDTVWSSHCLEDLWHPHQALAEWTRVLAPGGHLVLYLPLRDHYPNVGTPGANPGHKDDYVPEDVERFLREIGGVEIVAAARREEELSFEVVARKQSGRSWFVRREQRPAPAVSVLLVGDASRAPHVDATRLLASAEAAHRSLDGVPHEIVCLMRSRPPADRLAALRDLQARVPECVVLEDLAPLGYARRLEKVRRAARGRHLAVLAAGTVPLGDALARLHRALEDGAALAQAALADPGGARLEAEHAPGACLMLDAAHWEAGALARTPYRTPRLWQAWRAALASRGAACADVDDALAVTPGLAGPPPGLAAGLLAFDDTLLGRGVAPAPAEPPRDVLVVALRTLGDAVLALPTVEALARMPDHAAAAPAARVTVLTEEAYADVFAHHPAIAELWTVPRASDGAPFELVEDALVAAAVQAWSFDALHVLSDRLDNTSYHHAGGTLQGFYAELAGVPEAAGRAPRLWLAPGARAHLADELRALGVRGRYAVLHTRAGWPEKSLPEALAGAIAAHLGERHELPVVVLGGPGEVVAHPMALNLAGHLSVAQSAAVIAGAALFVGPDSGPLHIASALGVPSLALYAGSSPAVAPPLAPGSVSVQAARSCALPCGVSPCAQRCGFDGLALAELVTHLDALVRDGRAAGTLWHDGRAALLIEGPEGAVRVPRGAEPLGRPAALLPLAAPPASVESAHTARQSPRSLPDDATLAAHLAHRRALRTARAARPLPRDLREMLAATLDALPAAAALDVLRVLAHTARDRGLGAPALDYVTAALARTARIVRGASGPARPAYREVLDELFTLGAVIAAEGDPTLAVLDRLLARFAAHAGRLPPLPALLAGCAPQPGRDRAHAPRLRAALAARGAEEPLVHPLALQHAQALELLGAHDDADRALEEHLGRLPESCAAERAQVRLVRGRARVRRGALPAACADLQAVASAPAARELLDAAQQMLALIEPHLRRAAVAGAAAR